MKKSNQKLKLSKKTISRLTDLQMYSVRGGLLVPPTATAQSDCCGSIPASANCPSHTCPPPPPGGGDGGTGYFCPNNGGDGGGESPTCVQTGEEVHPSCP